MSKDRLSAAAFGCDPVFLPTSSLYVDSANRAPQYEADELNPRSRTPYGFYHTGQLFDVDPGFHVLFDAALSQGNAGRVLQVLSDGFFLDGQTSKVQLVMITYHAVHNMLASLRITVDFDVGGQISSSWDLQTLALEPYAGDRGTMLMRIECIMAAMIILAVAAELVDFVLTTEIFRAKLRLDCYLKSFWNYCDIASLLSLVLLLVRRVQYIGQSTLLSDPDFIDLDFHLLNDSTLGVCDGANCDGADLAPRALRVHADLFSSKTSFFKFLSHIESLVTLQQQYQLILGVCIFLLMLRLVHAFDFQARMGILTRTLSRSVVDLLHFGVLFALITLMYAALGTILFGHQMDDYTSLGASIQTLLKIVATGDGYSSALVQASSDVMACIFYWSFVPVVFFILMNIFLAIVVDAFVDVKSETKQEQTVPGDLLYILKTVASELLNGARSMFSRRMRPSLRQYEQVVQQTLRRRPRRSFTWELLRQPARAIEAGAAKIQSETALRDCLAATHVSDALGSDQDALSRMASLLFEQFSDRVGDGSEVTASDIVQLKLVQHIRDTERHMCDTQRQLSRMAAQMEGFGIARVAKQSETRGAESASARVTTRAANAQGRGVHLD